MDKLGKQLTIASFGIIGEFYFFFSKSFGDQRLYGLFQSSTVLIGVSQPHQLEDVWISTRLAGEFWEFDSTTLKKVDKLKTLLTDSHLRWHHIRLDASDATHDPVG